MGEGLKPYFHEVSSSSVRRDEDEDEDEDELGESSSLSNDSHHDDDDDESNSNEGELSSLVSQLAIKKGLSSFYQGKSQSFSSFAEVRSVLDLAKREEPTAMKRKMMKPSRSYAWGLDEASNQNANIRLISGAHCKNESIGYCGPSIARTSNFAGSKPPTVSSQQNS